MSLFERLFLPVGEKPKSGWIKWRHSGIPDEEGAAREKARDKAALSKGFTIEDSVYLKNEFERQAREKYLRGNYELGKLNEYGQRITIEIKLKSSVKDDIVLKTGWMIRPLGYITCNTPLGDR